MKKALLLQISPAQNKNWRAKKPYSASLACLEHSECWKPWSALVGLIWSMRLLGTHWVRKHGGNLWKSTFVWISSLERWNHWRKIPLKSYPEKTHICPMGTQWVRAPRRNIWKLTFIWISSFEHWNHWRKIPCKSYPKKTHISPMGTLWVRLGCGNLWKVSFS